MLDKFLEIGSIPDWVSPLVAMIKDVTNGPHYRFFLDRRCGWSVSAIVELLKNNGVIVWGDTIQDDMIIFTVRQAQAEWARYILQQYGLPILSE